MPIELGMQSVKLNSIVLWSVTSCSLVAVYKRFGERYCLHLQGVELTPILVQPTDITRTQYTKCRLFIASEEEQVMLETCRGP
jgi:hypothetical protein